MSFGVEAWVQEVGPLNMRTVVCILLAALLITGCTSRSGVQQRESTIVERPVPGEPPQSIDEVPPATLPSQETPPTQETVPVREPAPTQETVRVEKPEEPAEEFIGSPIAEQRRRLFQTPDDARVWAEIGRIAAEKRLDYHARWTAKRSVAIDPSQPGPYHTLAIACYIDRWDCPSEQMISDLLKANELAAGDPALAFALARAYDLAGQVEEALPLYDQLIAAGYDLAIGARASAAPATAHDLTGDGRDEVVVVDGRKVKLFTPDGEVLLEYEPRGDAPVQVHIVWLGDRLPSLWVQAANDQVSFDAVFAWSSLEGKLQLVWEEFSRGCFYDRLHGRLIKTISIRLSFWSGSGWAFREGRFQTAGGTTDLSVGDWKIAHTLEHLEILLAWNLNRQNPVSALELAQTDAWQALVKAASPWRGPGSDLGLVFALGSTKRQAMVLVLSNGEEVLRGQAQLSGNEFGGWRLEAVDFTK